MRKFYPFQVNDIETFRLQLLALSDEVKHFCYLDSNHYSNYPYSTFGSFFAIDAIDVLSAKEHCLEQMHNFQKTHQDWMFGFLNYDLKNEENDKNFNIQENYNYEPRNDQRNSNNNHIRSHTTDPYNKGKSSNNNANNGATRYGFSNTKFRPQPLDEKLACFGKSTYGKLVQSKLSTSHLYQNQPRTRYSMNESQTQPYIPSYIMRTKKKIGETSEEVKRKNKMN